MVHHLLVISSLQNIREHHALNRSLVASLPNEAGRIETGAPPEALPIR